MLSLCYGLFLFSVKNILFPREAKQKVKKGNEMEKRRRMNTVATGGICPSA